MPRDCVGDGCLRDGNFDDFDTEVQCEERNLDNTYLDPEERAEVLKQAYGIDVNAAQVG